MSNPPPPRDSDHVELRAGQAAEVCQGPRRALCAAGLHTPIPPVASHPKVRRSRHGLPDPRQRPPHWRRSITPPHSSLSQSLTSTRALLRAVTTRVRATGEGFGRVAALRTGRAREGVSDGGCPPRTPHSTPGVQRRECSPLSHGYPPGCGLTTSIASLVGPAQSGPPGGSGYRHASPRVDGSVGTADARVERACVCHCVCASARETIPRSVAHPGVAAGDAPLPYRACSDRGPSGLRGEWGHLTVL